MRALSLKFALNCIFILSFSASFGQPGRDAQLANQYYQSGEFEKAAVLLDKLYDKQPEAYYHLYFNTLLKLKNYSEAEKTVKKYLRKNQSNPAIVADLGFVYEQAGQNDKARQQYEACLKMLTPDPGMIIQLATQFNNRRNVSYAIETYVRARKNYGMPGQFSMELAELYASKGQYDAMLEEYLNHLLANPAGLQNIQIAIQTRLPREQEARNTELIRVAVLRRIQKYPEASVFSELLIWYMIQQKEFASAFIQSKALDKRFGEDGARVISLASVATYNEDYETAINCYKYVAEKGSGTTWYFTSRMEMLNVINKKLEKEGYHAPAEIKSLEQDYLTAIKELGKSAMTAPLIRGLAHLKAFHLYQVDEAVILLNEAISMANVRPQMQAEYKLELGDILVLQGDIWEAALLYGQVDKAFKNDPLGQEAKLRNARLSYFRGEFEWAKAQLDILKSATSQLISNDALSLSLLISDNTALDTTIEPLLMYARAELHLYQNRVDLAHQSLDSVLITYPFHSLTDEVYFKKATIFKKAGKFDDAAVFYQMIIDKYPIDILADDALYNLADLVEKKFNDREKAMNLYETLLTKYPGSLYVIEARKRYRYLRGDAVN